MKSGTMPLPTSGDCAAKNGTAHRGVRDEVRHHAVGAENSNLPPMRFERGDGTLVHSRSGSPGRCAWSRIGSIGEYKWLHSIAGCFWEELSLYPVLHYCTTHLCRERSPRLPRLFRRMN